MDMKTRLIALAGLPLLSLLTAVTFAAEADLPDDSDNATPEAGIIKNRNQCPSGTTFFKNVFPSLTNGVPGGSTSIVFDVDGEDVAMTVTWNADNSFGFEIDGGIAPKVGVTVDTNNFIYSYAGNVQADANLNAYSDGTAAGDVNHLDLCLSVYSPDVESPVVTIDSPLDGDSVSGIVIVSATVTDNAELSSIVASVNGESLGAPMFTAPDQYTWSWDTTTLSNGDYTLSVTASDSSENSTTVSVVVTTVTTLQDCLEGPDLIPPGQPSDGGCNLTGFLQLEYPNEVGAIENLIVRQAAIPAISVASSSCRTDLFPLIAQDPRVALDGTVTATYSLDLSTLFDIAGHYAQYHPLEAVPEVWMRADTVGSPCLTLVHQDAPDFSQLTAALPNGGVYTVTQFPELVPGMYDYIDRITAPLSDSQPDLQFVEQATLQTDDPLLLIEGEASPFTSDVFNASRTRGFDGTFFPLNTREACLFIDPALSPDDGAPYFEAVLQCKTDLAVEYFDSLEQALLASEPNLISPKINDLLTPLNKARSMVKVGRWNKATTDLTALSREVTSATWNIDYRNDPGNLIMRIDNLFFRIDQLDQAESNLP